MRDIRLPPSSRCPTSAPDPSRTGVFAVYFDLLYESGLVTTKNDPANRFGFAINFAPPYNSNGLSANNSFLNVVDEIGAFQSGSEALGSSEFLLAQMTFRANTAGVAEFVVDPADLSPFHDVLLFEPPAPVAVDRINLGVASITVLSAGAEGEYTNPQNSLDVNADGFVSPADVLMIFNDLSSNGSRQLSTNATFALGEGESLGGAVTGQSRYIDSNGDGFASPLDALQIINFLNAQSQYGGEAEGSTVLLANAVTSGSSHSPAILAAPSLVIDTARASSNLNRQTHSSKAIESVSQTRAFEALFAQHSQADTASSRQAGVASELISEDLLDLLADRNEI